MMTSVLDQPTLVLNKNWTAIGVQPVHEAVGKVCSENAKIVDPHDYQQYTWEDWLKLRPGPGDDFIPTARLKIKVPDVIVLSTYDRVHSRNLIFNRRNLFARDVNVCQYCGKKYRSDDLSVDHVIPQCQGGPSTWENCVLACVDCNVRKGGRTPRQANMQLVRVPVKPKWSPVFRTRTIKPTWGKFIDVNSIISELYWQVELEK